MLTSVMSINNGHWVIVEWAGRLNIDYLELNAQRASLDALDHEGSSRMRSKAYLRKKRDTQAAALLV